MSKAFTCRASRQAGKGWGESFGRKGARDSRVSTRPAVSKLIRRAKGMMKLRAARRGPLHLRRIKADGARMRGGRGKAANFSKRSFYTADEIAGKEGFLLRLDHENVERFECIRIIDLIFEL